VVLYNMSTAGVRVVEFGPIKGNSIKGRCMFYAGPD